MKKQLFWRYDYKILFLECSHFPGYVKMLHLLPARMKYSDGRSRGKIKLDRIVLNLNMYVLITDTCQFISNRNKEDAVQVIASHNRLSLKYARPSKEPRRAETLFIRFTALKFSRDSDIMNIIPSINCERDFTY